MKSKWTFVGILAIILLLILAVRPGQAQDPQPQEEGVQPQGEAGILALMGNAFTYQGQLKKDGNPINGNCDFKFSLWNAAFYDPMQPGGGQVGSTQTKTNEEVTNGLFTITNLDFGAGAFQGDARWLEIAVRCPAGSGSYTTLSSRQKLNPAPYALALPGLYTIQSATSPNLIGGYSGNRAGSDVVGATIGGGGYQSHINTVADDYGTIGGGNDNTASGEGATIGGGIQNIASGGHATIGGGIYNQSTGSWDATVGGGYGNIASGQGSTVPGGIEARAVNYGQMAYASGKFANVGDAQTSVYVVRGITDDDDWHSLYLDGVDRQIFLASGKTMTFDILVVGRTQGGKSNGYRITGVVENVSGTLTVWYSVSNLHEDDSGWGVQVITVADNTLHVQVNGDTGDTVHWVATVHTVEVAW